MKPTLILIALIALSAVTHGCKPEYGSTTVQDDRTVKTNLTTMSPPTSLESNEGAYARKAEYVEQMRKRLGELRLEVDALAARVEKANDTAKAEAQPRLQALRDRITKLENQLDNAKGASESAWEDAKSGLKKGLEESKEAFQQARQWLSEKIAP